jgi:heme exporter protein C
MKGAWWKISGAMLVLYAILGGLLLPVPERFILNESIRNLYYHVPMWFTMTLMLSISFVYSIRYLAKMSNDDDNIAVESANVGIFVGLMGCLTGMLWARYTWGAWWPDDPKLRGAASGMLIYLAYMVLRGAISDETQKAKIAAVYNVFAYPMFIVLIFVLPRMTDSLHPGSGGNAGFVSYDLDSQMRLVFYPAVLGWMIISIWITSLRVRLKKVEQQLHAE